MSTAQLAAQPAAPAANATPKKAGQKIGFFNARGIATDLAEENQRLREVIDKCGGGDLLVVTRQVEKANHELAELEAKKTRVSDAITLAHQKLRAAQASLINAERQVQVQDLGFFDYEHPAESSADLAAELVRVRAQIKEALSGDKAADAASNFTFNGSTAQGNKFTRDMKRLLLRAYNAEAENCVKTVRAGNLATSLQRLNKAADQIHRMGTMEW